MKTFICEVCKKSFKCYQYQRRGKYITCSNKCFGVIAKKLFEGRKNAWINKKTCGKYLPHLSGKKHPRWKGGKYKHSFGYIFVYKPKHKYANKQGYILEHRLIMEKHIGRPVERKERVHHINGIPDDNRIENLKLFCNQSGHMAMCHSKKRDCLGRFVKHKLD